MKRIMCSVEALPLHHGGRRWYVPSVVMPPVLPSVVCISALARLFSEVVDIGLKRQHFCAPSRNDLQRRQRSVVPRRPSKRRSVSRLKKRSANPAGQRAPLHPESVSSQQQHQQLLHWLQRQLLSHPLSLPQQVVYRLQGSSAKIAEGGPPMLSVTRCSRPQEVVLLQLPHR